ncbi:MAG: glycosyltransferase [Ignavibacteria bacterium]|nr:glycosyltransferase [Ignavibacteria bacterium]
MINKYSITNSVKKAAVVLMRYDYGIKERGFSFEYVNIYLPICDLLGKENVLIFDFFDEYKSSGKESMNKKLKEFIKTEKPDFTLFCLFENEMDEAVISSLREWTKTIVYFFDDPWRQKFVRSWIKHFDYFSTSDYYIFKQYKLEGIKSALYSPFGFNENVYVKRETQIKYDVSFVGGYSPLRKWIVNQLLKDGINIKVFGRGWGSDYSFISQDEMVDVFNQSKINLNLSNGISNDIGLLFNSLYSWRAIKHILLNKKNKEQVKGRHFEINACGGFQLSYFIPGLNLFYEIDKEIAVYEDVYNLSDEIKFFLNNDELRLSIANKGYERSTHEHSAQKYLSQLINNMFNK